MFVMTVILRCNLGRSIKILYDSILHLNGALSTQLSLINMLWSCLRSIKIVRRMSNYNWNWVLNLGPETEKTLWLDLWSQSLGTSRSPREADRRDCRPVDRLTGRHCSTRNPGAIPTMQCRTRRAILYSRSATIAIYYTLSICRMEPNLRNSMLQFSEMIGKLR